MTDATTRFDVVVVGAGSAGAVVAARLSEDPRRSVLLLEAGPDHRASDTPASIAGASFLDAIREPGRVWPGLQGVRTAGQAPRPYVRGRGVGGSSAVNAMLALPGDPADYDAWGPVYGVDGWSWAEVAPWFDRIPLPMRIVTDGETGAVGRALLQAEDEAEHAVLNRFVDGRRASVNDVYLEPARRRPNLTIRGDSLVDRVLFDGRAASGVLLAGGEVIEAVAVVVAGGAIHSPTILLRSGLDRPGVGHGLQDHPSFPITIQLRDEFLARPHQLVVTSLLRATHAGHHDLQVLPLDDADPMNPGYGVVMGALMKVQSRGSVRLASADPTADPVVDFAMLADERDDAGMIAAVELVERVVHHEAFARIGTVLPYDPSPTGVRAALGDYVHAAGTCAMGPEADERSVVDAWGAVHGRDRLWVVDASIFPEVPRANTHLPTVMLAERISEQLAASLPTSSPPSS